MSRLTTHVLDTARGLPAVGMRIRLFRIGETEPIADLKTNADGRSDTALLSGEDFQAGCYRLVFSVADYHRELGVPIDQPPFLDEVEVAFGIADAGQQMHVPLLISPWSYSTYRGS